MNHEKRCLRRRVKTRLSALSTTDLVGISVAITTTLAALPVMGAATVIAFYCAFGKEPAVTDLVDRFDSAVIAFPRWNEDRETYEMAVVEDAKHDFILGKYGISEPSPRCRVLSDEELSETVWLIPGVAFDKGGGRLGRGGGFYDRLLRSGTMKIGIACRCQLVDAVPTEVHE